MEKKAIEIDYLDEDAQLAGQLFVVLSFLSPEGIKNCNMRGVKVRGVFPTEDKANKHVELLRKKDPYFDIFVAEVGKWCAWDDKDKAYNQEYNNKELNSLMKAYKENKDKSSLLFEQRKNEMKTGKYEEKRKKKMLEKLQKQRGSAVDAPITTEIVQPTVLEQTRTLEELQKEAKDKEQQLNEEQKTLLKEKANITKQESLVSTMEERLKRVDEVYKKLNQK